MDELPKEVMDRLAETISRLNETMEQHSAVLLYTTGNTEEFNKVMGRLGRRVDTTDKILEAAEVRRKHREMMMESSARQGAAALGAFTGALLDGTAGLQKYNQAVTSSAESIANKFEASGTVAGNASAMLARGFGFATVQVNELTDRTVKAYQSLAKFGLASEMTSKQIVEIARQSGFAGAQTELFTKALAENQNDLRALGSSTTQMVRNFGLLTRTSEATRRQLDYIGSSVPEFLNFTAQYTSAQIRSGKIINQSAKSMDELREATMEVYKNFKVVAEVTGVSVDQQLENQKKAAASTQYQMFRLVQEDKAAQLRAQYEKTGDIAAKQRADAIQADLQKREELAKVLPTLLPGQEAGIFETLAQENLDIVMESNKSLQLLTQGNLGKILRDFINGTTNINQVQAIFAENVKRTAVDLQGLAGLGTAAQPTLEAFGLLEGTIPAAMAGLSEASGKTAEQVLANARTQEEQAKKDLDARMKTAESLGKLATSADDGAMAVNAMNEAASRFARETADKAKSIIPPEFAMAITAIAGIAGLVGQVALLKMMLRTGPGGVPIPGSILGRGSRIAMPGDFGIPSTGGFGGGALPGGAGGAGGGAGGAGGVLARMGGVGGLAKLLPGIGTLYSGYEAFQNVQAGNYGAAGLNALAGIAGLIPGIGTGAKLLIQGGLTGASSIAASNKYGSVPQTQLTDELKEQTRLEEEAAISKLQTDTTTINYFERIYKELIEQTFELEKLNSYAALQAGLTTGSIKPVTPGMQFEKDSTMFTGADKQQYVRIPFGGRYNPNPLQGGSNLENRPSTMGGPSVATSQEPLDLTGKKTFTADQLSKMGLNIKPGAHGSAETGYSADLDPRLANALSAIQSNVPGFNRFTSLNDGIRRLGPAHDQGRAVDFTLQDSMLDPRTGLPTIGTVQRVTEILQGLGFSKIVDEYNRPSTHATGKHFHAELAEGGIVTAPLSALIGEGPTDEIVQPLLKDSILEKLAKTPSSELEMSGQYNANMQNSLKDMITSINRLGDKLASMQQETNMKLDTSNAHLRDFLQLRRA